MENRKLGISVEKQSRDEVILTRCSRESWVRVALHDSPRDPRLKEKIRTPYPFLNHMLETLSWRSCINIEIDARCQGYELAHVICEDTGWSLGAALLCLFRRRLEAGVEGDGHGFGLLDEALTRCHLAFEGRPRCQFLWTVAMPPEAENLGSDHLVAFFEGLSYGAELTVHLSVLAGVDPHHIWESIFRAFGKAVQEALRPCPWRAGTTPGVKGF